MSELLRFLGIHNTSANVDQFLISIYSALFTGSVVGIVVWLVQVAYEKRGLRRQYRKDVAVFREHLQLVINQAQSTDLLNRIGAPLASAEIMQELSQSPLELWHENVPKEKKLFAAIQQFQEANSNFMRSKDNLLAPVSLLVRKYNNGLGKVIPYDSVGVTVFLGHLLGFADQDILPWVWAGVTSNEQIKYCEDLRAFISAGEEITYLVDSYLDARTKLENSVDILRVSLT